MITPLRMQSRDVGQSAYTTSDRSKGRHLKQSRGKLFPKKEPSEAAPKTIPSESRRSRSHRTSHDTRVKEEHIRQGVIELSDDELFEEIQGDEQDTNNDSAIVLYNKRQDNVCSLLVQPVRCQH